MQVEFYLANEEAHLRLATSLAGLLPAGVVYLQGDLGSGKTTFARGWIRSLGQQGAIKSPTYTLVEPYTINGLKLYHFDLYRLGTAEELEYLGIRDYFTPQTLCLIEWPEQGQGVIPSPDLQLSFSYCAAGRRLSAQAFSLQAQQALQQLTQLQPNLIYPPTALAPTLLQS